MRTVTLAELAEEAASPRELVEWLVELGQIRPVAPDQFDPRDEAIVTTVQALLDAGIAPDDVGWIIREGGGGFETIGRLFDAPKPRSTRTYRELQADLGPLGHRLSVVYSAFGFGEPDPDQHLRVDEESIVRGFVETWQAVDPGGDADLRVARLSGETSRRLMEGWLDVWDKTAQPTLATQGAPSGRQAEDGEAGADPESNPTIAGSGLLRELVRWLHERQLEETLNRRVIEAIEGALVAAGRLDPRPVSPPAVAFVDLTGFTTLTERLGDEAASVIAGRLQDLAETAARTANGRVVKLLGDGVLMHFESAGDAIPAVLGLVAAIPAAGLPAAHAGVAAGTVVVRDGDLFGRTVNLAARIGEHAGPGQVLVEEGAVIALPRGTARFEPLGRVEIRGLADPVSLWRAEALEPAEA